MLNAGRSLAAAAKAKAVLVFPNIVKAGFVVGGDAGNARNLSTTTLKKDVYAFIFDQKGLTAGIGIQGSKITRIRK